jgi:hypothetical protein
MRRRTHRKGSWPPRDAKELHHQGQTRSNPRSAPSAYGQSRKIARRFTPEAFKTLAAVMQDQEAAPTARVNAANTILEWGHGRRGDSAKPVKMIDRIVKVDWGRE